MTLGTKTRAQYAG